MSLDVYAVGTVGNIFEITPRTKDSANVPITIAPHPGEMIEMIFTRPDGIKLTVDAERVTSTNNLRYTVTSADFLSMAGYWKVQSRVTQRDDIDVRVWPSFDVLDFWVIE